MWSCSLMLVIKGLDVIFRDNGVRVPFPSRHSRTTRWVYTGASYMWSPWPWSSGAPSWKESICFSTATMWQWSTSWPRHPLIKKPWWPWSVPLHSLLCSTMFRSTSNTLLGSAMTLQMLYCTLKWTGSSSSACTQSQIPFPQLRSGSTQGL